MDSIPVIAFLKNSAVDCVSGLGFEISVQFDLFSDSGFILSDRIGDGFLGGAVIDAGFNDVSFSDSQMSAFVRSSHMN
jgi:hypothetical protein